MSKLGPITKGEASSVFDSSAVHTGGRYSVWAGNTPVAVTTQRSDITEEQAHANAALYADAHNTANRTGKLPSELEAELRQAIATLQDIADLSIGSDKVSDANQLAFAKEHAAKFIAKSTGK